MKPLSYSEYLGYPVVDGIASADGPTADTPTRRISVLAPGPGLAHQYAHETTPRFRRTLLLQLLNHADIDDVCAFVDQQAGRLRPFWLPSWVADMTLAEYLYPALYVVSPLVIEGIGYTEFIFPPGSSRRHIQLGRTFGFMERARVLSSIVGEDPDTEILTIDSHIVKNTEKGAPIYFLRFCRLDVDEVVFKFDGKYAECELPVVELPQECPE